MPEIPNRIVFYDGDCGFCNRSVNYVLNNDTTNSIHFASLQAEVTKEIFSENNWPQPDLSTFYFMEDGILYQKSKAAFKVLRYFPWYLKWLQIFRILPIRFRDWIYDQVAKRRRKIAKGYCVMPEASQRKLFLS
ncbi:MAG: DCC1-like thiol-disulfide oxidoreductase family protein [Crocinitomicaceae bacterium]